MNDWLHVILTLNSVKGKNLTSLKSASIPRFARKDVIFSHFIPS